MRVELYMLGGGVLLLAGAAVGFIAGFGVGAAWIVRRNSKMIRLWKREAAQLGAAVVDVKAQAHAQLDAAELQANAQLDAVKATFAEYERQIENRVAELERQVAQVRKGSR